MAGNLLETNGYRYGVKPLNLVDKRESTRYKIKPMAAAMNAPIKPMTRIHFGELLALESSTIQRPTRSAKPRISNQADNTFSGTVFVSKTPSNDRMSPGKPLVSAHPNTNTLSSTNGITLPPIRSRYLRTVFASPRNEPTNNASHPKMNKFVKEPNSSVLSKGSKTPLPTIFPCFIFEAHLRIVRDQSRKLQL